MVIDCHGHYTTAPQQLEEYRQRQIAELEPDPGHTAPAWKPGISDDQIRESLEHAQLRIQRERGTDLTVFSPRAVGMGHHIGNESTSQQWSQTCNELIHRVCTLYPKNFAGVCQLPQTPGVRPTNCIGELERCVNEFGFIGCNLNPDPSGGYWSGPPLSDRWWYPLYEKMVELDVPAMIHVSGSCNPNFHATGAVRGIDPETGHYYDDTKRHIDAIDWLGACDREKIFHGNARRVYRRLRGGHA